MRPSHRRPHDPAERADDHRRPRPSPDGNSYVTAQGFDHHTNNYRMLNCGCERQSLYSYSSVAGDSDAGCDINTALGSWTATSACQSEEGGTFSFYAAMR